MKKVQNIAWNGQFLLKIGYCASPDWFLPFAAASDERVEIATSFILFQTEMTTGGFNSIT